MKKLLLLFLFIGSNCFSQIGEVKDVQKIHHLGYNNNMTKFHSLSYTEEENGKLYILNYRNMEYQHLDTFESISFYATDEELDYLFNFLKDFNDKDGKTLEIGKSQIFVKKMGKGIQIVNLTNKTKGWFFLLPKEIERLFGKR